MKDSIALILTIEELAYKYIVFEDVNAETAGTVILPHS